MQHPLTILFAPLPQGSAHDLRMWRNAFETALVPWLDARQLEHVRRFGKNASDREKAGQEILQSAISRLLARALLVTSTAIHGLPQGQIGMDSHGRPMLSRWRVAFSHSGQAAFCALALAGQNAESGQDTPDIGLDAEALSSPPPHAGAFAARELAAPAALPPEHANREAMRRWTIKEAMLKAAGLGLGMQPAQIPTGRFGQRAGQWQGPLGLLGWRSVACPGHWLCVAQAGQVPAAQIFLRRQAAHTLLRNLKDMQPQP